MERSSLHRLGGVLTVVLVAIGLYQLVGNVGLAVVAGLNWGSGLLVTLRITRLYPDHVTGTSWADGRWTGLSVGLVTLAALVGVSPTLPLTADLRFGLGVLVLGAGFVGYATAVMAELERGIN